jgi:hypothetical protein
VLNRHDSKRDGEQDHSGDRPHRGRTVRGVWSVIVERARCRSRATRGVAAARAIPHNAPLGSCGLGVPGGPSQTMAARPGSAAASQRDAA